MVLIPRSANISTMKTFLMQTTLKLAVIPKKTLLKLVIPREPEVTTIAPRVMVPVLVAEYSTVMVKGRFQREAL